jgi:hypothetical protein
MKRTYLFIGGPADGQRIETDGQPEIPIPWVSRVPSLAQAAASKFGHTSDLKITEYALRILVGGVQFYAEKGIAPEDALQMLVEGYRVPSSLQQCPSA